ncbi:MAG: hypothetical protein ACE5KK_02220 [Candidatus Brocadiales bacterium]
MAKKSKLKVSPKAKKSEHRVDPKAKKSKRKVKAAAKSDVGKDAEIERLRALNRRMYVYVICILIVALDSTAVNVFLALKR